MKYKLCAEPGCGELIPVGVRRCERHEKTRRVSDVVGTPEENERERAIAAFRASYAWKRARALRRRVDGNRCTSIVERTGERCDETLRLEVHHEDQLVLLWETATTWEGFVAAATDVERLRTVCENHHPGEEEIAREQTRAELGGGAL